MRSLRTCVDSVISTLLEHFVTLIVSVVMTTADVDVAVDNKYLSTNLVKIT